ncbi:unnamed protein product [Brachionus calyciflorus]|uniref:Uncharacterized protein n=1 Tax=Brachionus calyciflorus TaxID=104777 RepID=A0A814K667_9BILA|nr:unnamed protein product [Brachionus calyciflorus]
MLEKKSTELEDVYEYFEKACDVVDSDIYFKESLENDEESQQLIYNENMHEASDIRGQEIIQECRQVEFDE